MLAHGPHTLHVLTEPRPPDLHLDGAKAPRQIVVGLAEERVERQIEVDAARIARHPRIVTAEQPPERRCAAARLHVPQGDVHGRDRHRREATAPAVVQGPPHALPEPLDASGVGTEEHGPQVVVDERGDGGAARSDGIGVAHALGAVAAPEPDGDQLEARHGPVRAVGQDGGERNRVVVGLYRRDGHGGADQALPPAVKTSGGWEPVEETPARARRRVQLRGGARRPGARRSLCGSLALAWISGFARLASGFGSPSVSARARAPTKQMGPSHRSRRGPGRRPSAPPRSP